MMLTGFWKSYARIFQSVFCKSRHGCVTGRLPLSENSNFDGLNIPGFTYEVQSKEVTILRRHIVATVTEEHTWQMQWQRSVTRTPRQGLPCFSAQPPCILTCWEMRPSVLKRLNLSLSWYRHWHKLSAISRDTKWEINIHSRIKALGMYIEETWYF